MSDLNKHTKDTYTQYHAHSKRVELAQRGIAL